jgi:hypothetical protein
MESQRLELGPNRWVAAGGLAFIHVRVWKGWMVQVSAAPVRDMVVGGSTLLGIPLRPVTTAWLAPIVLVVLLFPDVLLWLLFGGDRFDEVWTPGIVGLLLAPGILLGWILWRGRPGIFHSADHFFLPNRIGPSIRIYLNKRQMNDTKLIKFCDHLTELKVAAGDERRKARTYILFPWWASIVFALLLVLWIGLAVHFGFEHTESDRLEVYAMAAAAAFCVLVFAVTPERNLLFDRDIRRALNCLLDGDAHMAAGILEPILDTRPEHVMASRLITITRLMQCDLQLAEDLVIPRNGRLTSLPSRYHRIMDTKLWETRHDDP